MSLSLWGVGQAVGWLGIALLIASLLLKAGDVGSIRQTPRGAATVAFLLGVGAFLFGAVLSSLGGDLAGVLTSALPVALLMLAAFGRRWLPKNAPVLAVAVALGLLLYKDWLEGDLTRSLLVITISITGLATLILFVWLREKRQRTKPSRDAHA